MNGEIITIYLPIFEEKLARLEFRGRGDTEEAQRLRRALYWARQSHPKARSIEPEGARAAA